ncbi:MAG: DNA-directed RNA polymerase subunit A', partial [Candidatus Woesearchaeota archaeon]|nr:DNA-directed RNA polymerase subunit A' [Candidatus Woesearchaeota archaeon]
MPKKKAEKTESEQIIDTSEKKIVFAKTASDVKNLDKSAETRAVTATVLAETENTAEKTILPGSINSAPRRSEGMSRETAENVTRQVFKQVKSVLFGLLSPKMVKKMASAKIVTPELYDKEGYPVDGGLMDIRLGVIDPGLRCKTCGSKLKECIGHFGYVELARPVVHLKFVPVIYLILKSTCKDCGRILVPQEKHEKFKTFLERIEREEGIEARRKAIKQVVESLKTTNKCPHCKAKQIKVKIEKPTSFVEDDRRIMPVEIRARLERVPDQDCELFGLNPTVARPEWMILTVLAIPPVTVRPSITLETGERSEDDLTHKLGDIVRINQRLFENINAGAPEIIIEDLWDLLQYHVTTFFDNNVPQLPPARHRSGQPLKTITERIKSKEGRIRHNLAGKRTNFCARTVISPDPMIRINEVGVPRIIAMKLTVPEIINDWNMAYLKKFVERGPGQYPGANYIIRPDGKKKKITEETKEAALEELQPGYVVERHLLDGDISIFNRQPSLHRMSMMCHRVKVLPGRTLRLNPAVCAPYNADFDGDEMNLHVPQTEESRAEAELLMEVQTQLVSPKFGISVIGCTQDGISGNYLLTKFLNMSRAEAIELIATVGITDFGRLPRKEMINGAELFSLLLPEDFNYTGKAKDGSVLIIKEGKIIEGFIDSKAIGGDGEGLMLRSLHKQYG